MSTYNHRVWQSIALQPIRRLFWLGLVGFLALTGCAGPLDKDAPLQPRQLSLSDMAKGDVDLVAEVSVHHSNQYLRELAEKLYRRNPVQLARAVPLQPDAKQAAAQLFRSQRPAAVGEVRAAKAIDLAFVDAFNGDRVAAFIVGLRDMQRDAYGGEQEFFLHHRFDPQRLYYLARNFEVASWRLRNSLRPNGRPYLLSVGGGELGEINTSFERLFGKLIGVHDHFAQVVADTSNRQIKNVVQGVASAVFFPI